MPDQERKQRRTRRIKVEESGLPVVDNPSAPKEETAKKFLGDTLSPQIMTLSGGLRVRFFDGQIQLDKSALETEIQRMDTTLHAAILSGDEKILTIYLRNVEQMEDDEGAKVLAERLRAAFRERDPRHLQLDAIHVDDISRGIAERNLIREGLRGQIARQPFTFRDGKGRLLDAEDDVDFVFARDANDSSRFKIIVGSKKGIDTIAFPQDENFPRGMFRPDMAKVDRDEATETITIPLKASLDGNSPQAVVIEVRKGPVDLPTALAEEERQDLRRKRAEEEAARQAAQYNPPRQTNYGYASR
jgi:hypothetical protein